MALRVGKLGGKIRIRKEEKKKRRKEEKKKKRKEEKKKGGERGGGKKRKPFNLHCTDHPWTTGINIATMGVLFKKADKIRVGKRRRT